MPLILSNSLRWLHPVGLEGADLMVTAGSPFLLPLEHGVERVTVRDPDGATHEVSVTRGALSFTRTDRVGLYSLVTARGEVPFAVNLLDASRSNIQPQPLPVGPAPMSGGGGDRFTYQRELWRLLLLLAIATLLLEAGLYWRRQTAGQWRLPARHVDRWAFGLRGVALVVLLWALAQPQIARWVDRQNVFFLLDMSDSITLAARENGYRAVATALTAMKGDDRAGLITFAREPRLAEALRVKPAFGRPQPPGDTGATNIERAIQLALASFPPGEANRIVLLSDGQENGGRAQNAVQAAKDAEVPIYAWPLGLTLSQEVVLEDLLLPPEAKFGEPFYLKVVLNSVKETAGRLSLYRNGEFLGSQVVHLVPGKNVLTYRQALEQPGVHVYQALIEVEGTVIEENKRAFGVTAVRGKPQVLLVDKEPTQAQNLASALRRSTST